MKDSKSNDILCELTEPAVLFLVDEYNGKLGVTICKLGNKDKVQAHYDKLSAKSKGLGLIEDYRLANLPLDVDILNKVWNNGNILISLLGL
jgi:hypothetical protein